VATATAGQVYVADGAASGDWKVFAHASFYYAAIGTGTTYTAPTAYTLIGPTTVLDAAPIAFSSNNTGRLTYTGVTTTDVSVTVSIAFKHSTGSGQDCYFQIYKNGAGVTGAEFPQAANSTNFTTHAFTAHFSMATNDYLEVYLKTSSGNVIVHAINLIAHGHP